MSTPQLPNPPSSTAKTNSLGDFFIDARDPGVFTVVLPKAHEFFYKLDRLGLNPLQKKFQPNSCSKIRIIKIPDGLICSFVIDDGWTAEYTQSSSFSGITHFGQRGADNPYRAISHADTNTLSRLAQSASSLTESEVWKFAKGVADAFEIEGYKFEKPELFEEGLFDYRLGIYAVRYRKKGSNPINQMNYTRSFSLKATSPTSSVLVRYSHLDATLP